MFAAGRVLQLDNFRSRGYGWPGFTKMNLWKQDKGCWLRRGLPEGHRDPHERDPAAGDLRGGPRHHRGRPAAAREQ